MAWTERMDAILRHERSEGRSFSQTAAAISHETGVHVTRNACISRAGRIGLPQMNKDRAFKRTKARKLRKPAPVVPLKAGPKLETEALPEVSQDDIPTKTFDQIEDGHCKFRIDVSFAGEPYGFCGKKSLVGLSWCDQHLRRVVPADQINSVLLRSRAREKAKKEKEPA